MAIIREWNMIADAITSKNSKVRSVSQNLSQTLFPTNLLAPEKRPKMRKKEGIMLFLHNR